MRPGFQGPISGLKIEGPLYLKMKTDAKRMKGLKLTLDSRFASFKKFFKF